MTSPPISRMPVGFSFGLDERPAQDADEHPGGHISDRSGPAAPAVRPRRRSSCRDARPRASRRDRAQLSWMPARTGLVVEAGLSGRWFRAHRRGCPRRGRRPAGAPMTTRRPSSSARTAGTSTPTGRLLAAGQRADRLGYDSLWTWDHLYPIVGSPDGPILEGYTAIAAWAQATTERGTIGLMVGANTFRNPALVAKMMTTLDHISGGRAILGIGAAWFETEHTRLRARVRRRPARAAALAGARRCRSCAACSTARGPSPSGPRYRDRRGAQRPAAGPARTCRSSSAAAASRSRSGSSPATRDANNVGGSIDNVAAQGGGRCVRHCEAVGRDEREIERTTGIGYRRHPRLARRRRGGSSGDLRAQRRRASSGTSQPVGHARGRRRAPRAVRRARLPPPHRRASRRPTTRSR